MGRAPCCDKANVKRGPWSPEEDAALKNYLEIHGNGGNWIALPRKAGLKRCGKSCRLRWLNYLRPNIKHGGFTEEEDDIILTLFNKLGSRWSVIASHLPGRTDNDVKNHWNTKLKKRISMFSTNTSACGFMASHGTDQGMLLAQCSANLIQKTNTTIEVDDAANRSHPWGVLIEMADLDYRFMANSGPFLPAFSNDPTQFLSETISSRDSCNSVSAWDGDGDVPADGVNLSYQDQGYAEDDGGRLLSDFEVGFRFPHEVIHALCIPNSSTDFNPHRFLC